MLSFTYVKGDQRREQKQMGGTINLLLIQGASLSFVCERCQRSAFCKFSQQECRYGVPLASLILAEAHGHGGTPADLDVCI